MKIKIGIVLLVLFYFIQDGFKTSQWTVRDTAGTYSMNILRYWGFRNIGLQGELFFYEDSTAIVAGGCMGPVKGKWYLHDNEIYYCMTDSRPDNASHYIAMKIWKNGNLKHEHIQSVNNIDPDDFVYNDILYIKTGNLPSDSLYKAMGIAY